MIPGVLSALGNGGCRFSVLLKYGIRVLAVSLTSIALALQFVFTAFLSPIIEGRYMRGLTMFEDVSPIPSDGRRGPVKRTSDEMAIARRKPNFGQTSAAS